jgi:plastocyanin
MNSWVMNLTRVVWSTFFLLIICFHALRTDAATHIVNVYSSFYSPSSLQIAPGDTVFWVNQDDFAHTVTSANNAWQRGYLFEYLDDFGLTFPGVGTYSYFCEFDGFSGTIVVANSAPPPANDQCSSAIAMTPSTLYTVSTAGATTSGDPSPSCGTTLGKGVWYTITAAATGPITISTCGSDFDTILAVYTGACGSLTAVSGACNDDDGVSCIDVTASLVFSATAGTTYRILAGGYTADSGTLKIMATAAAGLAWQEAQLSFDTGVSIARPNTNLVHLVDQTNDRLLTLNTDSGTFVSSIRLQGKLGFSGLMCFSLDGQFLYVPLNAARKLQVISLGTLATVDVVPLTISPNSAAAGSDGMLYVIADSEITKINPATGQKLGTTSGYFYSPMLKANGSGTRLYLMELGLSGGGAMIDEYAVVPSAMPSYVTNHFNSKANDKDFVIAEDISRLYSTSGGVYGIGAWNMTNRTYSYWPYDSAYGVAVAMVPNDTFVYGSSGNYYTPRIRRFDRLTGAVSATFDINAAGRGNGAVYDRSLQVTPNGRVFYARETRKIGLIGASALSTTIPVTAEIIDAGTNLTVVAGEPFVLSAIAPSPSGGDTFSWAKIAGSGAVTFSASNSLNTIVQIAVPGNYRLEIVRSNANWTSRDAVDVTATPRPLRLDQIRLGLNGPIQMRLRSEPGSFTIEATSNFLHWDPITNVLSAGGEMTITDPATNRPHRFYRAHLN